LRLPARVLKSKWKFSLVDEGSDSRSRIVMVRIWIVMVAALAVMALPLSQAMAGLAGGPV